jgi:hypothetical protein
MPDQGNKTLIPEDHTEYIPTPEYEPRRAIDFLDEEDPNSLYNKFPVNELTLRNKASVPKTIHQRIKELPKEWLDMDEYELADISFAEGKIKAGHGVAPNQRFKGIVYNRVRLNLWREYASAVHQKRFINTKALWLGACSMGFLYRRIFAEPAKLAWILCPPPAYEVQCEETLITAMQRLREYIEHSCFTPSGKPDHAHAKTILQIAKFLDQRVHGAIPQRIDQRILKANVTQEQLKQVKDQNRSMSEIDREIAELEAKASQAKNVLPAKLREKYEKEIEQEEQDAD